ENEQAPRRRSFYNESQPAEFIISILKNLLMLFAELVVIGVNRDELNMSLATFTSSVLKFEKTIVLLPEIGRLMYQISQGISYSDDNSNVDFNPVKIILVNMFNTAIVCRHPEKQEIIMSLRAILVEMFKMFLQNNRITQADVKETLLYVIVDTMLKDLVSAIEQ
ncbi:Hypothetical predicted protein, partial [Paramuricea clavata]